MRHVAAVLFLSAVFARPFGAETVRAADPPRPAGLTVVDEQGDEHFFSPQELEKLVRVEVKVKEPGGAERRYDGSPLAELLAAAGVKLGEDLKGDRLRLYVVVEAADDYRVVFSLAELDPAISNKVTLLADRRDGEPLAAGEGPYRLVVPDEKRRARWVRQVRRLVVADGTRQERNERR